MSDFQEFGNILAKRYAQAVGAANKQKAEQPVTQDFESYEQSSFNQEVGVLHLRKCLRLTTELHNFKQNPFLQKIKTQKI